ncbi:hypothetical protein [Poriferisphaera sp. WC338]|uniref:hypothetical protein n=1 Tax=Poriferisphaera sp. WC338 TaxID=3425129 RepID=UPI003D819E1D
MTIAEWERINGRPMSWWERIGYTWHSLTSDKPLLEDYDAGILQGGFKGTGTLADVLVDTAPGAAIGQVAEGVVDTAEVTADVAVKLAKPWFLAPAFVIGAVVAVWIWLK